MENHKLDINKRYKNVSKTWDNTQVDKNWQKVIENDVVAKANAMPFDGDPFSNVFQSRLIDEVEPYLKELGERIELNTDENLYDDNIVIKNVSSKVNGKFDCDRDPFSDFCQKIVQDEVDNFLDKREKEFSDKTVDVYGKIGLTGDNGTVYAQSAISSFGSSNSIEMVDHPTNLDKVFEQEVSDNNSQPHLITDMQFETFDSELRSKVAHMYSDRMFKDAISAYVNMSNLGEIVHPTTSLDELIDTNLPKDDANNCLADIELKLDENLSDKKVILTDDEIALNVPHTNLDKVFDKMEDEKHSLETNDVYDWTKSKQHPLTKGLSEILEDEVEELDEAQIWMRDSLIGIGEHGHIAPEPKLDTIEKAPQYNSEVFPEVIVMMEDNFKIIATMCFAKLNSFKYRMRTGLKDVKKIEEDIKKAMNYESRYKAFLEKMKSIFYKDKVLPLIIGDETFEMKVVGNDYKTEIQNIKLYLEKYATETK